MGGGGSGGGSNTTVQTQQIPPYEQAFSQENQDLARSITSQPFPNYPGQLIAGQNDWQTVGQNQAVQSAGNYMPFLSQGWDQASRALDPSAFNNLLTGATTQTAHGLDPSMFNNLLTGATTQTVGGLNPAQFNNFADISTRAGGNAIAATDPSQIGRYMSPFVQNALQPQISDLNQQLAQQQMGINAGAAQAGAFGDARQGVAQGLQNYYGNQAMNELVGTGYNNAYTQALNAMGQAQQTQLGAGNLFAQLGGQAQNEQGLQLQGANQLQQQAGLEMGQQGLQLQGANQYQQQAALEQGQQAFQLQGAGLQAQLANQLQQQELTGANAIYNVGQQQQTLQQQNLNAAYQQYLNQINWPFQMLNVREGALSNSPYNIATSVTLPSANSTAQGFGMLAGAAGLLGGLAGGGGGNAPFGGARFQ